MRNEDGRIVETAVEARGGFLDRPILLVLIASMSIAIVLLALFYVGFFAP